MNNGLLQLKIKERLNKLASLDYDNFECWQIQEAFNKAQIEWVRRRLHGINQLKEGSEDSIFTVDDVQILLTDISLVLTKKDRYYESDFIPTNYMQFVRVGVKAAKECCDGINMVVYQGEEANVEDLLADRLKKPSYEWGETFCTLVGNKVRIYTNNDFDIESAKLTYYRTPRNIEFNGCVNVYTQTTSTANVESELKEDVIEVVVDNAAMILAGDIESLTQYQREQSVVQNNT
jgi:hypothetical protein